MRDYVKKYIYFVHHKLKLSRFVYPFKYGLAEPDRYTIFSFRHSSSHNMAPLKVIGAGYGRTGTDSLRTALNILGYALRMSIKNASKC